MQEVESLNRSIREFCPEIISSKILDATLEEGDEMNQLIEHRIKMLSRNSEAKISQTKP